MRRTEIYRPALDPGELHDWLVSPNEATDALQAELTALLGPRVSYAEATPAASEAMDAETRALLQSIGYLEP